MKRVFFILVLLVIAIGCQKPGDGGAPRGDGAGVFGAFRYSYTSYTEKETNNIQRFLDKIFDGTILSYLLRINDSVTEAQKPIPTQHVQSSNTCAIVERVDSLGIRSDGFVRSDLLEEESVRINNIIGCCASMDTGMSFVVVEVPDTSPPLSFLIFRSEDGNIKDRTASARSVPGETTITYGSPSDNVYITVEKKTNTFKYTMSEANPPANGTGICVMK